MPINSFLKYEQRRVPGTSKESFIRQCLLPKIYMCLCFRVNMPQQGGNKYVLHQLFKALYIPSVLEHCSSWDVSALPSENASKYLQIGQENMLWNEYKLGMAATYSVFQILPKIKFTEYVHKQSFTPWSPAGSSCISFSTFLKGFKCPCQYFGFSNISTY